MLDFLKISTRSPKRDVVEIYPKFIIRKSSDLMIRGSDFYAIWDEERGLWSTDEQDALRLIDQELDAYAREHSRKYNDNAKTLYMWDADSGMVDKWHKYCQKQMRDSFNMLDEKLIFANSETNKKDYASKRLDYPLEPGEITAYDRLMSVLYSEEERHKIEWAIGAIITGDSKSIQKFMVLYGAAGTGKSTILNIIQDLFKGYYSVFDAKALGSNGNSFALEAFKTNPLVAIQHDGDLSRIEDNTRLNSLVSHEEMTINEKFKSTYSNRFKCFLFMGTNKPVKITDGKSGLIRRLIDVSPSGNKLSAKEYVQLTKKVKFELGAIACHCRDVYLEDPDRYNHYIPVTMMGASNDFYNFILDSYHIFKKEDSTTLKAAWEMYRTYCDEAKVPYPFSKRTFKEELKNYFWDFNERFNMDDGSRVRSYYTRFRTDIFEAEMRQMKDVKHPTTKLIDFKQQESIFDKECGDFQAQYATKYETPYKAWDEVKTKLSDLNTSKLHMVRVPENHIVIDFDIKGPDGKKSFERNLEEASKWPATYAELSKSGGGIHLHYIYTGDPSKLSLIYDENIEVKVFSGKSSLRRLLTKCNNLPIATISSGLPLKGEDKVVNFEGIKNEKALRTIIKRNLNKEYQGFTKPSVSLIHKSLEDAYNSGMHYDVSDMKNAIIAFAASSTNNADYCIKLVNDMKFKSDEPSANVEAKDDKLVFYDIEVFPNLFIVNWKLEGLGKPVVRMINPTPTEIEELLHFNLVGFNCRRYDNHILYARLMGYDNEQLFKLSQRIVAGNRDAFFGEAYNISYTDVYDFSSNKQSLKKWEIELGSLSEEKLRKKGYTEDEIKIIKAGTHHQELGLPWDQPVPEELWEKVAAYCDNDVIATEATFVYLKGDWIARQILADLAEMTKNDTTNSLTTRIIFGREKKPKLVYTDLATGEQFYDGTAELVKPDVINAFPGYEFVGGKNMYRGEDIGKGGYVWAKPGMYGPTMTFDVVSQHPHSIIAMCCFGEYTPRFKELLDARIAIKHKDFDTARKMLDGRLAPYLEDESNAKALAQALKIAINSVYGLTSASFDTPFRDIRNKNNIVALRGALFMATLKDEVIKMGYQPIHCKTDSIKIFNPDEKIYQFVMDFGKKYGYEFEVEHKFEKICLVNDAVYIAKLAEDDPEDPGKWTATGTQFAVPYVFKSLFSKEPIEFSDMCETKSVKTAIYLDMNEGLPDVSEWEKLKDLRSKSSDSKWTKKEVELLGSFNDVSDEELDKEIAAGHNYRFIGKVGQFCPIKDSFGGGLLMRDQDGKYVSVTGAKGYRWLESEMVKQLEKEGDIDRSYYDKLVDDAVTTISEYGDFEWFVSDEKLDKELIEELDKAEKIPEPEYLATADTPLGYMPCGVPIKDACDNCPDYNKKDHICKRGFDPLPF